MCTYSEWWRDETWERSLYRAARREQRKHARGNGVRRRRRKVRKREWKRAQQPLGLRFVPTRKSLLSFSSRKKEQQERNYRFCFFPLHYFLSAGGRYLVPTYLPTSLPSFVAPFGFDTCSILSLDTSSPLHLLLFPPLCHFSKITLQSKSTPSLATSLIGRFSNGHPVLNLWHHYLWEPVMRFGSFFFPFNLRTL